MHKIHADFYTSPPTYKHYVDKLMELKNEFPFVQLFSIGQSVLGRQIFALSIGNMKQVTLMAGAFHAQEWLTTTLLVRYLERVCLAVREKSKICGTSLNQSLSQKGLLFVPMVNPDGVCIALEGAESAGKYAPFVTQIQLSSQRSWQANVRGVDLNHNYDAGFRQLREIEIQSGITGPSPRQYGGQYPHSEPETMAMVRLCLRHNISTAYAFHSQGEEIFYEYGENPPAKGYYMAKLLSHVSGYTLVKNDGLYSHGGFKDYFIERFDRPGFTIEIGKGENPLPITDLEDIYERLLESMVIMSVL
ncbi:M14 family metallocarboxypeptidase [Paludicola sp. MB14-C6]|uniref:M14 family metallopeptidase n=1 Tax=Paludihabitans sp. MB14-C6 TaxID=3070656 RepID=UPI0027DB96AC|nr:M14 family metallocarboxypeptidase [Paludicola sp. MB14-C6]WMJ24198.1 M14 family metallocarboxypeptidase [Paludicola sp. MB14-C6]